MIRIHNATKACFLPLGGSAMTVYYRRGYFNMQVGLWLSSSDSSHTDVSFDILDSDIFGDDIEYDVGAPVTHHWNSIYNFQSKGEIFCSDLRGLFGELDEINLLTGTNRTFLKLGQGHEDVGYIFDALHYGAYPDQPTNRCVSLPGGCMFACLQDSSWYKAKGYKGYCFARYPELPATYRNRDGDITFSPYGAGGHLGTYGGSVTVFSIGEFDPPIRLDGGWASFAKTVELFVQVPITPSGSPKLWHALWKQQLELTLAKEMPNLAAYPWGNVRTTALRRLPTPVLHQPDYDAIFDRDRRNPNWHELASQAYQGLAFSDINGLAYISDVAEMGAACRSFAKTLRSIPSRRVKAAAQAWLSVHYGFRLMLLDTVTLREELIRQSLRDTRKSKCQASVSYSQGRVSYTARYQVFYNQFDQLLNSFDQLLAISDFSVKLENIWDMVPYSFVIDWFASVGDILSAIDGYATLTQEHRVIAVGKSIKGTCRAVGSMFGLDERYTIDGTLITGYFRRYSRLLVTPSLLPSVTVNPFNHLVEGAALVISRK